MTSDDLEELVARAICGADGDENPDQLGTFTGKPLWMLYIPEARAAIAALRAHQERKEGE